MSSIEDFFTSLQQEKEKTYNEMERTKKAVDDLLQFLSSNMLFKDYGTFYRLLYNVQNTITPLIQRLLSFEMTIKRVEAQAVIEQQQNEQEAAEGEGEQERKQGLKEKLASIVRVRRKKVQPPKPQEKRIQLIEYGKEIVKRLDTVWDEYRARYYLIMFQDTEEEREREQYSNLEFISYVSNVCADIITFIDAAYRMRIQEIEARYENMVKALTVAEAQQPLPTK
jgi:hypothetical protein